MGLGSDAGEHAAETIATEAETWRDWLDGELGRFYAMWERGFVLTVCGRDVASLKPGKPPEVTKPTLRGV
jgi:hypothetical protein